jgi:hypothetical protein
MKKKITLTIDEKIWNFMEKTFTNKSAFLNALIYKYYTENHINISQEQTLKPMVFETEEPISDEILKELEILNAPRTD